MGAFRRMLLGAADLVDRTVRDREVDFVGRGARLLGPEPEVAEQGLGHAMMTLVFLERATPTGGQSALASETGDQPELLEGPEMGEGRRGPNMESRGNLFEARAARFALAGRDDAQRLDLTMGQLLKGLHGSEKVRNGIYRSP